jgi:hypothetical protein
MSVTAIATVPLIPASKFALSFYRIDVTIDMPVESASYAIADALPINAVPCAVSVNFPFGVGGATSVKAGLGISADPDKYFLSPDKLPFEQSRGLNLGATPLSAIENLLLSGVDTNGAASGTIGGAGISAVVSID